ncbi:MAG: CheR family methyltransferase [Maricaulaceae bacterium]
MSAVLSMPSGYYDALKRLTAEVSGVVLDDDYPFTIETRLSVLARLEGYPTLVDMVQGMFKTGESRLAIKMVAAMLRRDTHFFEDNVSLRSLTDFLLPRLYEVQKSRAIKVLIVGSNSGQEAYSAAILTDKLINSACPDLNVEFTAIDYPSLAMDRAKSGCYTHFDVQRGLSARDMLSYFTRVGEDWVVNETLKNLITFRESHLLRLSEDLGKYHVILCRNFISKLQVRSQVNFVRKISQHIKERGYLLIGSNEKLPATVHPWIASGGPDYVYQRSKTEAELRIEEEKTRNERKLLHPDPVRFFEERNIDKSPNKKTLAEALNLKTA